MPEVRGATHTCSGTVEKYRAAPPPVCQWLFASRPGPNGVQPPWLQCTRKMALSQAAHSRQSQLASRRPGEVVLDRQASLACNLSARSSRRYDIKGLLAFLGSTPAMHSYRRRGNTSTIVSFRRLPWIRTRFQVEFVQDARLINMGNSRQSRGYQKRHSFVRFQ